MSSSPPAQNNPTVALSVILGSMQNLPNKDDISALRSEISAYREDTKLVINSLNTEVSSIKTKFVEQDDRLDILTEKINEIEQDKLRNNIRITGLPDGWDKKPINFVINLAKAVGCTITRDDITAYCQSSSSAVVACFFNPGHKLKLIHKIRIKKGVMAEEIFPTIKSNHEIHVNDHLTPHFSKLFAMARKAKNEGKLLSASSNGGRIRVKNIWTIHQS